MTAAALFDLARDTREVPVTEAGHVRSYADTLAWLEPKLERGPITRVYDAGSVDLLDLPVWAAVTPLAKDLTVHAGKGTSADAARASAVMEAFERISAERMPDESLTVVASYAELRGDRDVIDPFELDLPFATTYDPDRPLRWVAAYDLIAQRSCWVPRDCVVSPPEDGVCVGVDTNGLASGNSIVEATVHALLEAVERDAISRETFYTEHFDAAESAPRSLRIVEPDSLPPTAASWHARLVRAGMHVCVQHLTSPVGVPVFCVVVGDRDFPGAGGEFVTFAGYGADPDPARAVTRAVTEAVQSHSVVLLGARDTIEGADGGGQRTDTLLRLAQTWYGRPTVAMPVPAAGVRRRDLRDVLTFLIDRLQRAGHRRCLVSDLTQPHLDVPVVRVIVPGLAMPYGDSARRPSCHLLESIL